MSPAKSSLILAPLLLLLSACGKKPVTAAAPGPMEVGVVTVAAAPVALTRELPGRTSAYRVAEVRARVNGIILKRVFTEGDTVAEGALLYQIDPAPYEAAVARARATLARAEAAVKVARLQEDRARQLLGIRGVSQQDYDNAQGSLLAAEADVAVAGAALTAAEIDLGYTRVTAPIAGRIGSSQVTEGAYVQAGAATLLATIQQLDPIYVDLSRPAAEALQLKKSLESGRLQGASETHLDLLLDGGATYTERGKLQFSDVSVDPGTNSVTLRGLFPNPKADLLPGLFVRVRLTEATMPDALLVPQSAVTRNARGDATVLLLGADQKAELRVIRTARTVGDQWLVTGGLKPGDRIIVDHLHLLRPGTPVKVAAAATPAQ